MFNALHKTAGKKTVAKVLKIPYACTNNETHRKIKIQIDLLIGIHTWANESICNDTTVFLPINANKCQIYGKYHQKNCQQNCLQFSKMNRTKCVCRYRFTDIANCVHKISNNLSKILWHNINIDR